MTATLRDYHEDNQQKRFNILLVVSRPRPDKDVEYQLVAKCLVAIVTHVSKTNPDVKASLKILRPPTWQAFREHLRNYRYDLVHFDMKGEVQTDSKGTPQAVLEFCKPELSDPLKMKRDPRTAGEVGRELAAAGVKTAVLNACNSASFRDSTPGSNLAQVLLKHGVRSVLAMAYRVVEEAVEIFMASFYHTLLIHGASVQTATQVARAALVRNQSRRARYMHTIQLADYIVPVLYTTDLEEDIARRRTPTFLGPLLEAAKKPLPNGWNSGQPETSIAQGLLGRDYNILSLETLLSVTKLVFLHGQGGVGKTELLRYACEWWTASGWIDSAVYADFSERRQRYFSINDVLDFIGRQLGLESGHQSEEEVSNRLSSGRSLVIFDSAEVFDTSVYLDQITCSKQLPPQLMAFIDKLTSNGTMVVVASRLGTTSIAHIPSDRHRCHLSGLSVLDSVTLLQELTFGNKGTIPLTFYRRENIDHLRRAVILLEGNPTAIQLITPELQLLKYNAEALLERLLYGHDDHLHNWRFTALYWSLQDINPFSAVDAVLFDCAYRLMIYVPWHNPRQARMLAPILRQYLLQAHMVIDLFRPGGVPTDGDLWAVALEDHPDEIAGLKIRDQMSLALERESEVVKGFGRLAKQILEMPIFSLFEDVFDKVIEEGRAKGDWNVDGKGETAPAEPRTEVNQQTKLNTVLAYLAKILGSAGQKRKKGGVRDAETERMRTEFRDLESGLRMFVGDNTGAVGAVQPEMAREALSSTTGIGWERLADLHMYQYMLAVSRVDRPDYRKGLTHLNEWWRLHQGVGVSKRDQCYGLIKFAGCYHRLNQPIDAARTVIRLVEVGKTMGPADCVHGIVSAAHHWLYQSIMKLDKLHIFLDSKVVFSNQPGVAELSLEERVKMHQIMTRAKAEEQEVRDVEETMRTARQTLARLRKTVEVFDLREADAKTRELLESVDKVLAEPPPQESDWWLF
ncbi:hypothetical protein N0V88_008180 [Collariella sp. IMI 366227]|nr:hypothetical protein N0V88_008180 [Collariella sp. IMI 366227]